MKKLIFFMLICAMILSFNVFALADGPYISSESIYVAAPNSIPCEVEQSGGQLVATVEPGSIVYFIIDGASRAEDLTDILPRIYFDDDNSEGEEYVGAPSIEYRMLYDREGKNQAGYHYVFAMPILEVPDAEMITLRGRAALARQQAGSLSFLIYVQEDSGVADAEVIYCNSNSQILDFNDSISYASLYFSNAAQFSVCVIGQGPLNVGISFSKFTDIIWQYPSANIRCVSWPYEPIFNYTGTLKLTSAPDMYLYEIRGSELYDLTNTYSEKARAFRVSTRRLGSYVISDMPLGEPESTEMPYNPPTGSVV